MSKRILLNLMLVLMVLTMGSAQAAVRVAMIGSELTPSGEAVLGLAEVLVSRRGDVELLDRSTIHKVLREHDLLAAGFAQSDDAVQLGKLLAVDVFVHVESIPEQKALAVMAFETAQGIRLLDEVIAGGDASELSEKLVMGIDRALTKWQAPAGQSTAIALMSVRNVDLPRSRNAECDSLGALLERRLLGSPDVVVVERKRLQSLNRDHEITMDRPENRLLSAPVLLELDVEQAGSKGGFRAAAHLSDAKGAELDIVRGGAKTLPVLADKICVKILTLLKAENMPSPPAPGLEAARFFQIARFWKAQGRFDLTLASAEAAYALDSDNPVMKVLLINSLFAAANANLATDRPEALVHAARGMAMLRWLSGKPAFSNPGQKMQFMQLKADNRNFFRGYGESVGRSKQQNLFSEEESATYSEFCRDWLVQSPFSPHAKRAPSMWDLLLFVGEPDTFQYFPDNESAWRTLLRSIKRWINERMVKEHTAIPPWVLFQNLISIEDSLGVPADYRIRADLWSYFVGHGDPLLRWFGRCGRVFDEARQTGGEDQWATDKSRAFLNEINTEICNPFSKLNPEALSIAAWLAIRRNAGDIGFIDDRARSLIQQQLPEMLALAQAMLQAGHLPESALRNIQHLLARAERAKLLDLRNTCLFQLDQLIAAEEDSVSLSSEDHQKLVSYHNWVKEEIEPGSTLGEPMPGARVDAVDMKIPRKNWVGYAAAIRGSDGIYVLSVFYRPTRLLLQKWTPGGGAPAVIETVDLPTLRIFGTGSTDRGDGTTGCWLEGIQDVCLSEKYFIVALKDSGVLLINRNGAGTKALHEMTTLPVLHPLSLGVLGQTLYIATDDGYLVSFNLESRDEKVLVASSRKEKLSPFDDGPPVRISAMIPDVPRQRLVFVASVMEAESDLGTALTSQCGIWEYIPEIGRFRRLVSYSHRPKDIFWCEPMKEGLVAIRGGDVTFTFNLVTDSVDILSIGSRKKMGKFILDFLSGLELEPLLPEMLPVQQRSTPLGPPFHLRGDWLWTASPPGRLSLKTYQYENRPPFRMPDGSVRELPACLGMVPIDNNRTLFVNLHELWLVTIEKE